MRQVWRWGIVFGLMIAAAMPAGAQSSIAISQATRSGATATVSGTSAIALPEGRFAVGGTRTGFAAQAAPVAAAAGLDLVSGEVELLDDGVRFIWHVSDLPDQVPPEGVRYNWAFQAGDQTFQLQAKRTNVASATTAEDPLGHALHAAEGGNWFQLRGACVTNYPHPQSPIAGCYHLAFLDGAFDPAANTVTMEMPFSLRDSIGRAVAEDFVAGTQISAIESAGMSIAASGQAAVSNTTISSFVNGWDSFFTGPTVQLGAGKATSAPSTVNYTTTAQLAPDGSWTATVGGLSATNTTVFARACAGPSSSCVYTSLTPA